MAGDVQLPGIEARATLDLAAFRAQSAQLEAGVAQLARSLGALPIIRPQLDTAGLQAIAQQAVSAQDKVATQSEQARVRAMARAEAQLAAAEKRVADAQIREQARANQGALRDFDRRLRARTPPAPLPVSIAGITDSQHALAALRIAIGDTLGLGNNLTRALGALGPAAAGLGVAVGAIVALGTAMHRAAQDAAELQFAVAGIRAIKPEIDVSAMNQSLLRLSKEVPLTAKELAEGVYQIFSSLDISQTDAIKLMGDLAKGAVAARTDVATFSTGIIGILNAYKLSVADAAHVSDVFFNTVNAGVITGPQLAAGLGPVTAAAKAAGVSLEELGALIVGVTKEGGTADENLTHLKDTLDKLASKEAAQQLGILGIEVQDLAGNLRSPIAILTDLRTKLEGMTQAARASALQEIFPDIRARQGAAVLISQIDTVNKALAENQSSTGSTARAFETMTETATVQFQLLRNQIVALSADIGEGLLPTAVSFGQAASAAIQDVTLHWREWQAALQNTATAKDILLLIDLLVKLEQAEQARKKAAQEAADAVERQFSGGSTAAERAAALAAQRRGERAPGPPGIDPTQRLGQQLGDLVGQLRTAEAAADGDVERFAADVRARLAGQLGQLAERDLADNGGALIRALISGMNNARTNLGTELGDFIHEAGSQIAGALATGENGSAAGVAALIEGYKGELRRRFPELGDTLTDLIAREIAARGAAAWQEAANAADSFFTKLREGRATLDELAAAGKQAGFKPEGLLGSPQATQAAIQQTLEFQKVLDTTKAKAAQLGDAEVRAAAQRLLNAAAAGTEAGALQKAADLVDAHTAAQEATAAANKRAEEEQRKLNETLAKIPGDVAAARYQQLVGAVQDQLTPAQEIYIKQLQALGLFEEAARVATEGHTGADAALAAAMHGTNAELTERIRQLREQATAEAAVAAERAQQSQQRVTARVTLEQTGRLLPAPAPLPDARRSANDAIRESQRTLRDFRTDAARQETRAAADFARQQAGFAAQGRQIETDFETRQATIRATLATALQDIDRQRSTAQREANRTALREAEDFNRQWARLQRDQRQQDAESIRGLREQAGDLLVGATSQFHAAAASAVQGLLGLSGAALGQAAGAVVDQFQGVSEAAQAANQQIIDAQQTMLDKVRSTFQQINSQAADTIRGITQGLAQATQAVPRPGLTATPAGQLDPAFKKVADDMAAAAATLAANLAAQVDLATRQQSILTTAQKARDAVDKAAAAAAQDLAKQQLDLAKQAREQRAAMVVQLTRMVEGFQRGAFQVVQGRTDQREDTAVARARAEEDAARALGAQITALNRQQAEAMRQAADQFRDNEQQRDQERRQLEEQERAAVLQRRRQLEDADLADQHADRRHNELMARENDIMRAAQRIAGLLERNGTGVEIDVHDSVFVEPATTFLQLGAEAIERRNARQGAQ